MFYIHWYILHIKKKILSPGPEIAHAVNPSIKSSQWLNQQLILLVLIGNYAVSKVPVFQLFFLLLMLYLLPFPASIINILFTWQRGEEGLPWQQMKMEKETNKE